MRECNAHQILAALQDLKSGHSTRTGGRRGATEANALNERFQAVAEFFAAAKEFPRSPER